VPDPTPTTTDIPALAVADIDIESWRRNLLTGPSATQDALALALDEIERLRPAARWAKDATHLNGCMASKSDADPTNYPWPCTCGRDEALGQRPRAVADPDAIEARTPSPPDLDAIDGWAQDLLDRGVTAAEVALTPTTALALVAVARWAQDAPHHKGCGRAVGLVGWVCTCRRDEALARLTPAAVTKPPHEQSALLDSIVEVDHA